jgi:hypothetical protein
VLLFFASHLTPFAATILAAADLAQSLVSFLSWRQSPMAMLGIGAMILIMALLGLNRRQYCVRARQTALFLEQTRLARDDNRARRTLAHDELPLIAKKSGPTRLGFAALLRFFAGEGRFQSSKADYFGACGSPTVLSAAPLLPSVVVSGGLQPNRYFLGGLLRPRWPRCP